MTPTGKDEADSKTLAWLKIFGIIATIAASSIGSYKAARSNAKSEASASYATMKEAVEHLESNQKMLWDMMLSLNLRSAQSARSDDKAEKAFLRLPSREPLRPLPRTFDDMVNSPGGTSTANAPFLK
jgi:type II secretory pathway pseudopilin PulG